MCRVVTVEIKSRAVKVTGPRGTLERDFKHVAVELALVKKAVKISVWFGARKHIACIRTVATHISNMIKGVTVGFQFKMRSASNHFPVNLSITEQNTIIEIRNFLGEKRVRRLHMLPGVTVEQSTDQKDEIILRGNSLDNVSQSAASISQSVLVKDKDIRMFLDGIYVTSRSIVTVKAK